MKTFPFPLVRLPEKMEACLFLITEELKSRKLFYTLQQVGLDDCYFQPHLDNLILRTLHLNDSDETFATYNSIMDRRSKKIEADKASVMKQAFKAYTELTHQAKKQTKNELSQP